LVKTPAALALLLFASACGRQPDGAPPAVSTAGSAPRTEVVASGLEAPWAFAFAADGRIFLTERAGRIRVIKDGVLEPEPWATVPVTARGEAGLMGIALAPDFESSGELLVVGTFEVNGDMVNRVIRFTEREGRGESPVVLLDSLPSSRFHAGAALAFGPDSMLYITTGDAQDPGTAQDAESLAGKVLRYTRNLEIPPDNPVAGSPVFARGLRNTQSLAWNPEGALFATEHGPSGFPNERLRRNQDELNVIVAGGNYGWPVVSGMSSDRRFSAPLVEWTPAIAPAGIAVYTGDALPWRGNVIVAGLRGRQLRRVVVERSGDGWRATGEEILFRNELGRLRAVGMGRDGHLYIATSNQDGRGTPAVGDDRILRVLPGR
jgi:aldose sugar dehydrogenase